MDNSILIFITISLVLVVGYSLFSTKEGYESYPPEALSLAQKNEKNIAELDQNMKSILEMVETVNSIKSQSDTNTETISTLVDQCN